MSPDKLFYDTLLLILGGVSADASGDKSADKSADKYSEISQL